MARRTKQRHRTTRRQIPQHQGGVTLIELVVSIVILSVAYTGIMMVITQTTLTSADPMLREQATAIAQSYMEEIIAKPVGDPDEPEVNGCEVGETRPTYDDVWDYACVNDTAGAVGQTGVAVSGLEGYNVGVDISGSTYGGNAAVRIEVVITHDAANFNMPLRAYRLN